MTTENKTPLKQAIHECRACPLYSHMQVSPVATEWQCADPRGGVMLIMGTVLNYQHDLNQEIISGINRMALIKILKEYTDKWVITSLVKCCPEQNNRHKVSDIKFCSGHWIEEEKARIMPTLVLGFGSELKKYVECDHYFPAFNNVIAGKKGIESLKLILHEHYNKES